MFKNAEYLRRHSMRHISENKNKADPQILPKFGEVPVQASLAIGTTFGGAEPFEYVTLAETTTFGAIPMELPGANQDTTFGALPNKNNEENEI
jgi:hypothetical protein